MFQYFHYNGKVRKKIRIENRHKIEASGGFYFYWSSPYFPKDEHGYYQIEPQMSLPKPLKKESSLPEHFKPKPAWRGQK